MAPSATASVPLPGVMTTGMPPSGGSGQVNEVGADTGAGEDAKVGHLLEQRRIDDDIGAHDRPVCGGQVLRTRLSDEPRALGQVGLNERGIDRAERDDNRTHAAPAAAISWARTAAARIVVSEPIATKVQPCSAAARAAAPSGTRMPADFPWRRAAASTVPMAST